MICVLTMHHLEHYQFCIIVRFCFGTELHLYMHASVFGWIIPWFSAGSTNSTQFIQFCPVLVMSSSAVIVNMTWCGVSAKKSFCIYQSTTWLGRNRILIELWTTIFISKVKLCKSCLKTSNWFVVWLRMTSEFFPPTKPPSKTWKRLFRISFFTFKELVDH